MKHLTFFQKMMVLVLPPLLGLCYFSLMSITNASKQYASADAVDRLVELSASNSRLVHELQKERGLTAGLLGARAGGKQLTEFENKLASQRLNTNQALDLLKQFLNNNVTTIEHERAKSQITDAAARLSELSETRGLVDQGSIQLGQALGYYTQLNGVLLSAPLVAMDAATSAEQASRLQGYYNFLQSKERAGIERAVLSNTFNLDRFGPGMYQKFVSLVTEQNSYMDTFLRTANTSDEQYYQTTMNAEVVTQVEGYRATAFKNADTGGFDTSASAWFAAATGRINLLKNVEDYLTGNVLEQAHASRSSALKQLWLAIGVGLSLLSISVAMVFAIVNGLKAQLADVLQVIHSASHERNLTQRATCEGNDEIGTIAQRLNAMANTFCGAFREIQSVAAELDKSSKETSETIANNQVSLNSQGQETTMVASAIDELASTAQEVAKNISETAEATFQVDKITGEGNAIIAQTLASMSKLGEEVQQASTQVGELNERSQNISSLLDVIKSVAEQTNLLALNAAIEAARAGEQGRGFAVVADEVRSLAQRTQQSTEEIEQTIALFQSCSQQASESMTACVNESDAALAQGSSLKGKLNEITDSVAFIRDRTNQVATATEQQVSVTHEVAANVNRINDMALQAASGGGQIANAAAAEAALAKQLNRLIGAFKF